MLNYHRPVISSILLLELLILCSSCCLLCSAWSQNAVASLSQHQLLRQQLPLSAEWKSSTTTTTTTTTELFAKSKSKNSDSNNNNNNNNDNDDNSDVVVALLHSHHLLDHKPDNLLLKGGKYKLRGVAFLGRPGVALCIGPPKAHARFKKALESAMPQKRFKTKTLPPGDDSAAAMEGFTRAETLGDFRKVLASIDQEAEFFELTGIADPSSATATATNTISEDDGNTADGNRGVGKQSKKQRKRKTKT
eukprot:jgi/Psemu1/4340/gm1.4340_g